MVVSSARSNNPAGSARSGTGDGGNLSYIFSPLKWLIPFVNNFQLLWNHFAQA